MMNKPKILFISPYASNERLGNKFSRDNFFAKKAFMAPISLATINGLTPPEFETYIWDENILGDISESLNIINSYNILAFTGFTNHQKRIVFLAKKFKSLKKLLVIGGADVTATPEIYRPHFDVLFLGEGEKIWPQFLEDYSINSYQNEYVCNEEIDLKKSPSPNWGNLTELLKSDYLVGGVQTKRGCPFRCKFCDVWKIFGKKVRCKRTSQIIQEVETLVNAGVRAISFCDDNFIGNLKEAKDTVHELKRLNDSLQNKVVFMAELSIDIARHDDLLQLMFEVGFINFFIGIETPNEKSLEESNKKQNMVNNVVDSCKKILSYGIPIEASMIVGFDNDNLDIFDRQFDFFMETNIVLPRLHMLKAKPNTELWDEMKSTGRILEFDEKQEVDSSFFNVRSNLQPLNFTLYEMHDNFLKLSEKVYKWENYIARISGFIDNIKQYSSNQSTVTDLPIEAQQVIQSFESSQQKMVQEVFVKAINKHPQLVVIVINLLMRYRDEKRHERHLNSIGVEGFALETMRKSETPVNR